MGVHGTCLTLEVPCANVLPALALRASRPSPVCPRPVSRHAQLTPCDLLTLELGLLGTSTHASLSVCKEAYRWRNLLGGPVSAAVGESDAGSSYP